MIGKLRAWLAQRREWRRRWRKRTKKYARWLAAHPGGSYAQFYVEETRRQIDAGMMTYSNIGLDVDVGFMKKRAKGIIEAFKRAGCQPHHVVVDYGCGSLWIGEAFMDYLQPGNYVGLDVSDTFFAEGLARLPADVVARKRPSVQVISDAVLREVSGRKPHFILSLAVMQHVPPEDLAGYFRRIVSLAALHSRIEISHWPRFRTTWVPPRSWRHSRYAIRAALAPLGYAPEYRQEHRVMPTTPGFSIVRR